MLVLDGGTVFVDEAKASLGPTWPEVVCPTDAYDRAAMQGLKTGRAAAKRRDEVRSEAIVTRSGASVKSKIRLDD